MGLSPGIDIVSIDDPRRVARGWVLPALDVKAKLLVMESCLPLRMRITVSDVHVIKRQYWLTV
ncbi:uncharacterized protein BJ212DRAFT_1328651 [Suillus subaureus]|uniref:Uncharacterized protein n=1 Tax=Suillus subaureus TaxID=48587 RepID=A0A9P7EHY4_9AGAM|nr:uncharacterized protein BJ212DRAFT_1328651 [Suillus subaureus]KAG1822533.1 hypothetical protein BJ212DRAFT_1328651 [Suillus subaureus]